MTSLSKLARSLASTFGKLAGRSPDGQDSRFEEVFGLSTVAMIWASPNGTILRANQSMADLIGYAVDELENMPYERLLLPEDRADFHSVISTEVTTGKPPKDRERRYLTKDGRIVWGLRSVTLVMTPSGELQHKFVMIQDITERKQAQESLQEREHTLAVLNRMTERLNAEHDLEALLQTVTDAGVESIGAQFGALYSCRKIPEEDGYKLHALSGIGREAFESLPIARDLTLFDPILESAEVARWDDISADKRFSAGATDAAFRSFLAVPLIARSRDVIGALFLGHEKPAVFTERSERIITGLASLAAIAIEKASLFGAAQREIERRRSIEVSLNESEARFREFAEVGSDLLWETDDKFRIVSIVGDCRAVLGLPDERIIGSTRWEWIRADTGDPGWRRHIEDHAARRPFRNFEYQVSDESGATRWISANGRPFFDRNGRFLGYRGASTNIGARKHAEAKLAASARQQQSAAVLSQLALQRVPRKELYQVAVELVSRTLGVELAGIFEVSADQRVLRLCAGAGWPQTAGTRAVPLDYCPPLARSFSADVPVHFSRRSFNLIPGQKSENGAGVAVPIGEKSVRSGILMVCSNDFRAFSESDTNFLRSVSFVLAVDAEQRRTEATLKLRDRALAAAGEGILISDALEADNPLIYVNPAFERMTGYSRDEVVGRNARFLQGPETNETAAAAIRSSIDAKTVYKGTVLNYRKDGSAFWNSLTISPIVGEDGAASHFVGTLSDETERLELESRLKQAQKMESLGHLTGGVAHDFNNLLAVILGNSEILCDEVDHPELKEIAELIMTTAEKGAELTQRLLAFGRRQPLHPETLDLGEVVDTLWDMLNRTIGDHITLDMHSTADRPAFVDRNLFESTILNLVLNARDAMPNGGLLTIATDIVQTDHDFAGSLAPGEYVHVSVRDTGAGMTKDVLDRAFDPFFTTKNLGKGSGMGLSMVYGFAKQSGGHVSIDSLVGHGTCVDLFLPLGREEKAPKHYEEDHDDATGGTERILLVEDEPQLRNFVSRQLSGLGYEVLEAEAGAPALDILRSDPSVDLLFTDLLMPGGMSGFDLVQSARELLPHLKVLLTTGYAAETDEMIANIKDPILKKPYKKQQLARALRGVLEHAA